MPLGLPPDVWFHILSYQDRLEDSENLSRTCKSLRGISLPRVYQGITFGLHNVPLRGDDIEGLQALLSRICVRTESLKGSPHLCCLIQEVSIHNCVKFAEFIDEYQSAAKEKENGDGMRADTDLAKHLLSRAFEGIIALLSQLSRLHRLVIYKSEITPALHSYIISPCSQLTDLVISGCEIPEETIISTLAASGQSLSSSVSASAVRTTTTTMLKDLRIDDWRSSSHFDSYFPTLIKACLPTLQSMMVSDKHIPLLLSTATTPTPPLALQDLAINNEIDEINHSAVHLLISCPHIHTLKTYIDDDTSDLSLLPRDALPNLSHILGPPGVLRMLVPGRPVHCIELIDVGKHEIPTLFDMFQQSTAGIKSISLAYQGLEDSLKFIHSLYAFRHLQHLAISFTSLKVGTPTAKVRLIPPKRGLSFIKLSPDPGDLG
jgi:hypothetical protein